MISVSRTTKRATIYEGEDWKKKERVQNEDKCYKTKAMRIGENQPFVNIFLEGKIVGKVNLFKYLGSMMTWNGSCT